MAAEQQVVQDRFAANLRRLRERAGYSQENFAMHVGISRGYYGGIERGKHSPSLWAIVRLARALETTTSELLDGID